MAIYSLFVQHTDFAFIATSSDHPAGRSGSHNVFLISLRPSAEQEERDVRMEPPSTIVRRRAVVCTIRNRRPKPIALRCLSGTGRQNNGVEFVYNTYFTGSQCSHNTFESSVFENNIVVSGCQQPGCWTPQRLGAFFPTRYNLLRGGQRYAIDFKGLTADPKFGQTPETLFLLQPGSPAINAGVAKPGYQQDNVTDGKPDLGALEYGQTIDDWRQVFGHVGPTWINAAGAAKKAPHRPTWPEALDRRWGGLNAGE